MEPNLILPDFQPAVCFTAPGQNQGIISCFLQIQTEAASAIGRHGKSCFGGQCCDIESYGTGNSGPGQRTGGEDRKIFFEKGAFSSGQFTGENVVSEHLSTQGFFALLVGKGVFPGSFRCQIDPKDFSHVTSVFCCHGNPSSGGQI